MASLSDEDIPSFWFSCSLLGGSTIVVSGTDFGGPSSPNDVFVGDVKVEVIEAGYTTSELSFIAPPLPPADYDVKIHVEGKGLAALAR